VQLFIGMAGKREEGAAVRLNHRTSVAVKRSTIKRTCGCQAEAGCTAQAMKHPVCQCTPGLSSWIVDRPQTLLDQRTSRG
jgi:hypothetical protein